MDEISCEIVAYYELLHSSLSLLCFAANFLAFGWIFAERENRLDRWPRLLLARLIGRPAEVENLCGPRLDAAAALSAGGAADGHALEALQPRNARVNDFVEASDDRLRRVGQRIRERALPHIEMVELEVEVVAIWKM